MAIGRFYGTYAPSLACRETKIGWRHWNAKSIHHGFVKAHPFHSDPFGTKGPSLTPANGRRIVLMKRGSHEASQLFDYVCFGIIFASECLRAGKTREKTGNGGKKRTTSQEIGFARNGP